MQRIPYKGKISVVYESTSNGVKNLAIMIQESMIAVAVITVLHLVHVTVVHAHVLLEALDTETIVEDAGAVHRLLLGVVGVIEGGDREEDHLVLEVNNFCF